MRIIRSLLAGVTCVLALGCGAGGGDPGAAKNDCGGVMVDLQLDVDHCGVCTIACPEQANSGRACVAGKCGRKPCATGWLDLDPLVAGCEATDPGTGVPEQGLVSAAVAAGSSFGGAAQIGSSHTMVGALGEPTPAPAGAVETQADQHRNVTGFNAILH